jgi:hypothetical protein
MNKPSTLEQRIARARETIAQWPTGKLESMQLQGTSGYRDRRVDERSVTSSETQSTTARQSRENPVTET